MTKQEGDARRLTLLGCLLAASVLPFAGAANASDTVRISSLSDASFGTITNFASDAVRSQSICVYAKSPPANNYSIIASGSGAGGAFLLSSGSATLPYEVQWSDLPNQTGGTQLLANRTLAGQQSASGAGSADDCSKGPATTASLVVILRSSALASATSGTYAGTLTLLVAPE